MKKINLEAIGKSLNRNELRAIKGGSGKDHSCSATSYYCNAIMGRTTNTRWSDGVGCC